jgi:hypothetical protein
MTSEKIKKFPSRLHLKIKKKVSEPDNNTQHDTDEIVNQDQTLFGFIKTSTRAAK